MLSSVRRLSTSSDLGGLSKHLTPFSSTSFNFRDDLLCSMIFCAKKLLFNVDFFTANLIDLISVMCESIFGKLQKIIIKT